MNYLLTGPEEYLKSQFLERLKKSLLGDNGKNEFNFETARAGASPVTKILDFLGTLPFVSKHKIAVVKDVEKFATGEKDSILKYLKHPAGSSTLVLSSPSSGFNKFLKEISEFTKVINCTRLARGELTAWIRKEFAALKKKISLRLTEVIKERIGSDLFYLKNEIDKISSFAGKSDEITERHIEMILGKAAYETAFEFVNLILEKKIDKIFSALKGLLMREKPHRILSLLAWQFGAFVKIKDLPPNISVEEIARELGMNRYAAGKSREHARRFTSPDLKQKLETILEGDLFIKRGVMLPEEALERVLVMLCT